MACYTDPFTHSSSSVVSSNDADGLAYEPVRPVQYLGSKLRILEPLMEAADRLPRGSGRFIDLFTGSTVVAQAAAARGWNVAAVDVQTYSEHFARALLQIGKTEAGAPGLERFLDAIDERLVDFRRSGWRSKLDACAELRARGDANGLREFERLHLVPTYTSLSWDTSAIVASVYAGSYFGLDQAIQIDAARQVAGELYRHRQIGTWEYSAFLTATLHAASLAVHSAGKHFAQPLNADGKKQSAFHQSRFLEDRSVSVKSCIKKFMARITSIAGSIGDDHEAFCCEAEDFAARRIFENSTFYLDPPYTAQQYSRFYHVLETITRYEVPDLDHNGRLTSGLYPIDRYKSAFSSKKRARDAMGAILKHIQASRSSALISYSVSKAGSQGNARMIQLDELIADCREVFGSGKVDLLEFEHRYRQFNSSARSNAGRSDPEVLVVCTNS